jgi:hypothetical protein
MRQRVLSLQESMVAFTEFQIRTHRDTYARLRQALKEVPNGM